MPTIHREGPYRFFFYAGDRLEPPHVHVARDDATAKYWLGPVRLERAVGFCPPELRRIEKIIAEHEAAFLRSWHEYFGV